MAQPSGTGSMGTGKGRALVVAGWTAALVAVSLGAVVVGALVLLATGRLETAGVRVGLAGAAALVATLIVPLWLDRRITKAYRRLDTSAASTRKQTLGIWNALLVAVAMVAFPVTTRSALAHHGHWLVGGTSDASRSWLGRALARAASYIPRSQSDEPAPTPTAAPSASAATPSSAGLPGAPEPETSSRAAATGPFPVADHDLTPQEVFRSRADSVVVIAGRQQLLPNDPMAKLYQQLGVRTIDSFGSGFVVDAAGLIVTNHHVVVRAESLQVSLRAGTAYPTVAVLAVDREHDLALLHIEEVGLSAAPLAPDDTIGAGARAIAIGSPLGLEYSVTDGIVSAMREIQGASFLQMETTIAPGSSGGPLFDVRGRVMGVNTATRGDGLNLAVHVKHVRALLEQPRQSKRLATYVPGARVAAVTVEGAETSAVERMQLEDGLRLLSVGLDGCVKDAPADAYLTVPYAEPTDRIPVPTPGPIDTNLGETVRTCLKTNLELTGSLVGMIMAQAFAEPLAAGKLVTVVVEVTGLRVVVGHDAGAADRALTVRFRMGGSRPAAADAGAGAK